MGFPSTVGEHMCFQSCSLTKWSVALDASIGSFFAVVDHVFLQAVCTAKWLFTFWASVGLLSTVGEHVYFQMSCSTKWFLALNTIVHLFSAVGNHMFRHFVVVWLRSETLSRVTTVASGCQRELRDLNLLSPLYKNWRILFFVWLTIVTFTFFINK